MKARTLGGVEFIDVDRGDEIDLRPLGEAARFIKDEPASFHAGAQCVRHSRSLARWAHWAPPAHELQGALAMSTTTT